MRSILVPLTAALGLVQGLPQQQPGGETPMDKAKKVPQGITKAKDGSVILDTTEKVK